MKTMFLTVLSAFAFSFSAQAQRAQLCGAGTQFPDFCARMKHLRAAVNTVDSQRELMVVDYPFLTSLAASLLDNTKEMQKIIPAPFQEHGDGLKNVEEIAVDLKAKASRRNPDALEVANTLRTQCLGCHGTTNPNAVGWNDVFGFDWEKVSQNCNRVGRNPYLCKSMNALVTDYNHIWTAYMAKIENYDVTASVAGDMARLLKDLQVKNFVHLGEANRALAEAKALEIAQLAKAKDPSTFTKALNLNDSCMKCHSEVEPLRSPMKWGLHK